jgi:hypothetical protein
LELDYFIGKLPNGHLSFMRATLTKFIRLIKATWMLMDEIEI